MTLVRDPRCGRNFEYLSEDPLLSAVLAGESVIGTQSEGVVSMLKHVSLNATEVNKFWLDAVIDPAAHRESDLLAFQIAIERAEPGSLMGAYNKVNGEYCSGSRVLLQDVLKDAVGFKGWVMSDWKAVYDWRFALNGLDQHSGAQLDEQEWFNGPLKAALASGEFPGERLSEMVCRILRSLYAVGAEAERPAPELDMDAHRQAVLEVARQGIVLLKNDGAALPLPADVKTVAVIGGHADRGVLAGGGSSLVTPPGGYALQIPLGGEGPLAGIHIESYLPSSPLAELGKLLPGASLTYDPGIYPAGAAALAARCDVALVFATKLGCEGFDDPDLALPAGQDALIEAVAAANARTIVVLETGNPVDMPWEDRVPAIVQAWFAGQAGGQAIAEVLTGAVNPSGRLPITWPADIGQLPRPELPGFGAPFGTPHSIDYHEGAEVGYRWFALHGHQPRYAFGYGLSYTTFAYSDLAVHGGETVIASCAVTNTGDRAGAEVAQLYLTEAAGEPRTRLLGFERVELDPGESRRVTLTADRRLLARFDGGAAAWRIAGGTYRIALGSAADAFALTAGTTLDDAHFGR
jgi:beta-glucosidase